MPYRHPIMNQAYTAYIVRSSFALISTGFVSFAALGQVNAQNERDQILSGFNRNMGALNLYSPMEPAGSRGSIGIGVGAGVQSTSQSKYDELHRTKLGIAGSSHQTSMGSQKVYFIKGILAPVDIGLTASSFDKTNAKSVGGHVQVTLYEGFQMPAISVRASHAQMLGLVASEFTSSSADLGVSYGLLRYLSLYAGVGISRHSGSVVLSTDLDTGYLLAEGETKLTIKTDIEEHYQFMGFNLRFLPPFISATLESRASGSSLESLAVKVSVGI